MGCTSAFPIPLSQTNIKASMSKTIEPKIETKMVIIRQVHFQVPKTSQSQRSQAQAKLVSIQVETKSNKLASLKQTSNEKPQFD